MTACIVWRCTRPQTGPGLCSVHGPTGPQDGPQGPLGREATRWADLLDPTLTDEDVRAHNAALATNVLLDALR